MLQFNDKCYEKNRLVVWAREKLKRFGISGLNEARYFRMLLERLPTLLQVQYSYEKVFTDLSNRYNLHTRVVPHGNFWHIFILDGEYFINQSRQPRRLKKHPHIGKKILVTPFFFLLTSIVNTNIFFSLLHAQRLALSRTNFVSSLVIT